MGHAEIPGSLQRKLSRMSDYARLPMKFLKNIREEGVRGTLQRAMDSLGAGRERAIQSFLQSLKLSEKERAAQRSAEFPERILFSVLVPLYNTDRTMLQEMIASVQDQTYEEWELCLADGSDEAHAYVGEICRQMAAEDPRIRYHRLSANRGISENTNACMDLASGSYYVLLDHDDLLQPDALYENAAEIHRTGADFLYSDELIFASPDRNRVIGFHFKPDFAPDDLLTNNYICHLTVFKATLLEQTGKFRPAYDGSQDHDLFLRLTDRAEKVAHIPRVLYLWRGHDASVAGNMESKTYASDAGKRAVQDFLSSRGIAAEVTNAPVSPAEYRVSYRLTETPKVSLILPWAGSPEEACRMVEKMRNHTDYPDTEWILPVSIPDGVRLFRNEKPDHPKGMVRCIQTENQSPAAALNRGARAATGEYLVFLDQGLIPQSPSWIQELLMFASRENTGAAGGKVVFQDGSLRHAGVILGLGRQRTAARSHFRTDPGTGGYFGITSVSGEVSAVTAECMMIRKSLFTEVGGFDEQLGEALYDVDLCLKLRERNLLIVYTPYAELRGGRSTDYLAELGRESAQYPAMKALFRNRWQRTLEAGDPYYNPNFSLDMLDFRPRRN